MGPNRKQHQLTTPSRRAQAGITAIGFLILASLIAVVGLGVLKVVPMYLQNMRLNSILNDIEQQFGSGARNPQDITTELYRRFAVEGIRVPRENVTIEQARDGYRVKIHSENRARYMGDVYFVVVFNEQVEIPR
jgi:hypothetical protein